MQWMKFLVPMRMIPSQYFIAQNVNLNCLYELDANTMTNTQSHKCINLNIFTVMNFRKWFEKLALLIHKTSPKNFIVLFEPQQVKFF